MSKAKLVTLCAFFVLAASSALGGWAWAKQSSGAQEHPTAPQLIDALKDEWSEEQEVIVADGVITRDEYNATVERVAQCLMAGGMTVNRQPGGPGGVDELLMEWPASAGSPRDLVLGCYERYQGKLSMVWAEQNRPTAEEAAAHGAAIDECLASKGIIPKPVSELQSDGAAMRAYGICLAEVPYPAAGTP